jgi:hypothetical protein
LWAGLGDGSEQRAEWCVVRQIRGCWLFSLVSRFRLRAAGSVSARRRADLSKSETQLSDQRNAAVGLCRQICGFLFRFFCSYSKAHFALHLGFNNYCWRINRRTVTVQPSALHYSAVQAPVRILGSRSFSAPRLHMVHMQVYSNSALISVAPPSYKI